MTSRDVWVNADSPDEAIETIAATRGMSREHAEYAARRWNTRRTNGLASRCSQAHHIRITVVSPDEPDPSEVLDAIRRHVEACPITFERGYVSVRGCIQDGASWLGKLRKLLESQP